MLKNNILRRKKDFSRIYIKGKSFASKYLIIFYNKNNLGYNRTAFLASKKVGKSVKRNKARRHMKEVYLLYKDRLVKGYDIIFIARKNIIDVKFSELVRTTENILRKIKLLSGEEIWKKLWYY